ncbi:MAG: ABC-F family ATP-binding cassette domain-containing protein [Bacillota bacterium]|nr:ABC-F family ATP-binding cassette domain-containing protein [Bacillota bacterium]
MNIFSLEAVSKSYPDKVLFEDISFSMEEGEKVGLVGVNGVGKSTLLKIIAGLEKPDLGRVTTGGRKQIRYLSQNPQFEGDFTILEYVFKNGPEKLRLFYEYEQLLAKIEKLPSNQALHLQLQGLIKKIDEEDAWSAESAAKAILTRLGIHSFSSSLNELSGGERKRISLASALINRADLLLLDEPTNHVDNDTLLWLENYLANEPGALLMVTHDRYFLERVVTRIIELERGKIFSCSGSYGDFLEAKAQREETWGRLEEKRQSILRRELAWLRQGVKARRTRQKARVERVHTLQKEVDQHKVSGEGLNLSLGSRRLGKKVFELEGVAKSYEAKKLFDNYSFILSPDERLGIIGPNGSGKTTLLNVMAGLVEPDSGQVKVGETVRLGYYDQESCEMNEEQRVIDYIKEIAEVMPTADGRKVTASQMLDLFLFPPKVQWAPVGLLSGGEKKRLYLLRTLMGEPNVLFLDEPTNDLDIQTLSILEDYLENFRGAVVVISHDRYFLDRTVERLLVLDGEGGIKEYPGNYSLYREIKEREEKEAEQVSGGKSGIKEGPKGQFVNTAGGKKKTTKKLSYREQKELDELNEVIPKLEEQAEEIRGKMEQSGSDYLALEDLIQKQKTIQGELDTALERWVELTDLEETYALQKIDQRHTE